MAITGYGITDPAGGLPVINRVIQHAGLVYLCGITPDPFGDSRSQTARVLERIDRPLAQAGTRKSNLPTTRVWLTDMSHVAALTEVWNGWVGPEQPPVRARLQAQLFRPGVLVEITATATQ
jgi:enamine deaminase RidA (YjgF/YER057c/UK114 family)